jgi:hypothetical protein
VCCGDRRRPAIDARIRRWSTAVAKNRQRVAYETCPSAAWKLLIKSEIPSSGHDVGVSLLSVTPVGGLSLLILRTAVGPWEENEGVTETSPPVEQYYINP